MSCETCGGPTERYQAFNAREVEWICANETTCKASKVVGEFMLDPYGNRRRFWADPWAEHYETGDVWTSPSGRVYWIDPTTCSSTATHVYRNGAWEAR